MVRATQRYRDVVISGVAHVDAPHVITSASIEAQLEPTLQRLGVRPGLLEGLAGIVERRFWEVGKQPSSAASHAAEVLLAGSDVRRDDIGVLINTSVSRDFIEPSVASIVHGNLGLPYECGNFDVGNACLGFINGMNIAAAMIERGEIDHGLVVNAEGSRYAVEQTIARLLGEGADEVMFREQFATLTIGSGAVAMLLSRADLVAGGHRFLGGLSRAATEHALLCTGQVDEMRTDTKGLLLAGLELAARTWKEAASTFEWPEDTVDMYALHQISRVHTKAVCDTLGVDEKKMPLIFPRFGNIGPASVPMVVSKCAQDGRLNVGDRLILMGVGSGVNTAAAEVIW